MSSSSPDLRLRFLSDVTSDSYSASDLRRCIRQEDFWNHALKPDKVAVAAQKCSEHFYSSKCTISSLTVAQLRKKQVFNLSTMGDALCVRRTNEILRKSLRMTVFNRDDEVRQLLTVLFTENKCRVFRSDLSSFFETVTFATVIDKLEAEGFRNHSALCFLRSLNRQLIDRFGFQGLPRGLSISSTLADYMMHDFDRTLQNRPHVVYYCRYVDDICIIHYAPKDSLQAEVQALLPSGLNLNLEKTRELAFPSPQKLEFLGYSTLLEAPRRVAIATSKMGKAKKRIILSLRYFLKNKDFSGLADRLRFLSATVEMNKSGRDLNVLCGFRHVYRFCTEAEIVKQVEELDHFLHGLLTSQRYFLSRKVLGLLDQTQLDSIRSLSFKASYQNRISYFMGRERIAKIKQAWKYE